MSTDGDHSQYAYPTLAFLRPRWMDDAACLLTPSIDFFPEDRWGTKAAREVCEECEVIETCRDYALEAVIEFGVWGGTSPAQRRKWWREHGVKVET